MTAQSAWNDFVAANRRTAPFEPTAEDRRIVAEYNARGDRETYGPHFADVDGLAEQAEVMDAESELIEWLSAQTGNDFAQSLVTGYANYGSLTEKQRAAALRMRDRDQQPAAVTPDTDADEVAELAAWLAEQTWSDFAQSLASFYQSRGYLSEKQLDSARNMKAKSDARNGGTKRKALDTDGMYAKNGVIYKVQFARNGSGNLYAKRLIAPSEFGGSVDWEYEGRAPLYILTEDDKLSMAEAAEFGKLYGVCAICGRTLTDEDSIARGVGPVCLEGF